MSSSGCLPYYAQAKVVSGFGRGSKDLGIPTANFPQEMVSQLPESLECGVYYGWASVDGVCQPEKMVLSVGWNVFYGNKIKTMETHILKQFDEDFYGVNLRIIILGFLRPMWNFDSLDTLIAAIHKDISDAERELMKPECLVFRNDAYFESTTLEVVTRESSAIETNGSRLSNDISEPKENSVLVSSQNGVSKYEKNGSAHFHDDDQIGKKDCNGSAANRWECVESQSPTGMNGQLAYGTEAEPTFNDEKTTLKEKNTQRDSTSCVFETDLNNIHSSCHSHNVDLLNHLC